MMSTIKPNIAGGVITKEHGKGKFNVYVNAESKVAKVKTTIDRYDGKNGAKVKEKRTEIELNGRRREFAHNVDANGDRVKNSSLFVRSFDSATNKYGDWEEVK